MQREVIRKGGRFNQIKVIESLNLLPGKVRVSSFFICVQTVALSFEMFRSICLVVRKQRQRQADFLYFKYRFICLLALILFIRKLDLTSLFILINSVRVSN